MKSGIWIHIQYQEGGLYMCQEAEQGSIPCLSRRRVGVPSIVITNDCSDGVL